MIILGIYITLKNHGEKIKSEYMNAIDVLRMQLQNEKKFAIYDVGLPIINKSLDNIKQYLLQNPEKVNFLF